MDSKGIITNSRGDELPGHKKKVAREDDTPVLKELVDAVKEVKPHALIGLTGRGPAFSKVIRIALTSSRLNNPHHLLSVDSQLTISGRLFERDDSDFTKAGSPYKIDSPNKRETALSGTISLELRLSCLLRVDCLPFRFAAMAFFRYPRALACFWKCCDPTKRQALLQA